MELSAVFSAICMGGALLSYVVAALSSGYVDPLLARWDEALGFDWVAAYQFTAAHPAVQLAGRWAYATIFLSPLLVIAGLSAAGQADHCRRFVVTYALALALTVLLFAWFPARGPLTYYGVEVAYHTATGAKHVATIDALRAGELFGLELGALEGLVSAPSFHAASALLFAWAAWPLPRIRWIVAALNAAMLCATPVEGNHYLVDLIAGILLAWVTIRLTRRLPRWRMALARPRAGLVLSN